MATVVLLGTLDTKGDEYAFVRDRLREAGVDVLLVDTGVLGEPQVEPRTSPGGGRRAAGADHADLVRDADRGEAMDVMGRGAAAVLTRLHGEGRVDGVAAIGGSGNSSIAARAMRDLPVGVPKLIVSTVASGDTRPYVGAVDITMTYSVVDISGINQISARILTNAAGAIAGMATARVPEAAGERPLVGATMFGVTTPCVTHARERLEELGYEVLVFHATGTGGQSFEALATGGYLVGALDVTTTELADELVGGVLSAGPDRLRGGRPRADPAGRLARRARHGQLRPARHRARALRGPQPLRPQPDDHAHAHDARGDGRARAPDRERSSTAPTGRRSCSSRCAACRPSTSRASRSATRRPTRRCSPRCARASTRRRSRSSRSTRTSTTPRSPRRWPTASTS